VLGDVAPVAEAVQLYPLQHEQLLVGRPVRVVQRVVEVVHHFVVMLCTMITEFNADGEAVHAAVVWWWWWWW
jgi:hypothetical protein